MSTKILLLRIIDNYEILIQNSLNTSPITMVVEFFVHSVAGVDTNALSVSKQSCTAAF